MSKYNKILLLILSGTSDLNIDFDELNYLLGKLGFNKRIKGSHHIYYRSAIVEILNIQDNGGKAKAYQVKQVRNIILKYHLGELE